MHDPKHARHYVIETGAQCMTACACTCRNFLALLALVPLQRFIPLHQQMLLPLGLTFAVLVLAAIVALWTSASGAAIILTMLPSVGLMGVTTAVLQGGLFGLAGLCPPIYVQVTDYFDWLNFSKLVVFNLILNTREPL
jgi:hypothetical protein